MLSVVGAIITPAVIASLFSLFFGARAEKRRELRIAVLARLEESRTAVKAAVEAASAYFARAANDRTPDIEAKLWLAEREVRMTLGSLTERHDAGLDTNLSGFRDNFDYFVSELTCSNFQQKDAVADLAHIRKIAGLGAELRVSLFRVYLADLRKELSSDPLDRIFKRLEIGEHYTPLK